MIGRERHETCAPRGHDRRRARTVLGAVLAGTSSRPLIIGNRSPCTYMFEICTPASLVVETHWPPAPSKYRCASRRGQNFHDHQSSGWKSDTDELNSPRFDSLHCSSSAPDIASLVQRVLRDGPHLTVRSQATRTPTLPPCHSLPSSQTHPQHEQRPPTNRHTDPRQQDRTRSRPRRCLFCCLFYFMLACHRTKHLCRSAFTL